MKVAIMQPYFLPYIGYFQLMAAVDVFVILDEVNFIKGGWINRNRIWNGREPIWLTLPLLGASPNKLISQIQIQRDNGWKRKMLSTVTQSYVKAPQGIQATSFFSRILSHTEGNLARFIANSLCELQSQLNLSCKIIPTSRGLSAPSSRGVGRVLDICKNLGADEYWNLPGGKELYQVEDFDRLGISLRFIESQMPSLGPALSGTENLSILHLMMNMPVNELRRMLAPLK